MSPRNTLIAAVLLGVLVLSLFTFYTVYQTERAIVTVLGKLMEDSDGKPKVYGPGLHMKIPFLAQVIKMDARLQTLDIKDSRIVTIDKKDVLVNSFVKWRVVDFAKFYMATSGRVNRVEILLEQKVSDGLRAQFGRSTIPQVVSENRDTIMRDLSRQIRESANSLGIEVIDVRIKRIDLPDEVSVAVYDRMRAERQRVAAKHRADGEQKSEEIRAKADEESIVIVATAEGEARVVRGNADAKVTDIYGKAYGKDPEFYAFMRSLQAYDNVFKNKEDVFVLSPDSEFFDYFDQAKASQ